MKKKLQLTEILTNKDGGEALADLLRLAYLLVDAARQYAGPLLTAVVGHRRECHVSYLR